MKSIILKCPVCKNYTLKPTCKKCGCTTIQPIPARFSIQDKYGEYRRKLKKSVM